MGGIVGVGDEVEGLFDGGDAEECEHFVEQGAAIAIGPHQSLMDAHTASGTAKKLEAA